ncbi:TRAP transporter large permease [Nesterenkonia sp. HG001]|uniref:TRAP transporter large permease n=1 Tax=Nesterenkonia sp. HG001 TaxID=2983207 RepID=UPI002AC42757|nr:TRAP transporter large permease [Nesterenkonia sp. HG001]MDZ5077679.1 TRAP transporter large permease [Nesterenkonia sp. HG001]
MSEILFAMIALLALLAVGVPVAFAILAATLVGLLLVGDFPLHVATQASFQPTGDFLLLAIPFFILTADLLANGTLGRQVIGLATRIVGRFRGGVGQSSVVTSLVFSGVSGSAVADASGLGRVLIPWTKKVGYPASYAAAVNSSTSILGVIIPPSIPMILFAATSGASVAAVFAAGVVPGIILAVGMLFVCWFVALRNGFPRVRVRLTPKRLLKDVLLALPAIVLPVLMIRLVLLYGVATVTEVSVLAALYAVVLRVTIYRDLSVKGFLQSMISTSAATGVVMLLIMTSSALSWLLTVQELPQRLASLVLDTVDAPWLIMLAMIVLLLLVGMFLDMSPAILLLTPVLLPLADRIGMDPVHLGVVMVLALAIGLFTPPVGTTLYISSSIGEVKVEQTVRALLPFYAVAMLVLLLIAFVPSLLVTL